MTTMRFLAGSLLALATASTAHGQWSLNGVKVFYNAGNVGIGTNNPAFTLDVRTVGLRAINAAATAPTGVTYGLYAQTNSVAGIGAFGFAAAASGTTTGLMGQATSTAGRGVYGFAAATTGNAIGVFGRTNSATGFAGYFLGGRNYFGGNVGIGVVNPLEKLHVEGTTRTKILKIMGGADLAEPFNVAGESQSPAPGMVVVIDEANPGKLKVATSSYDRKVAGIISGANGLQPGLVMVSEDHPHTEGDHPVALTGRVWCYCDASFGPIASGDLLTTSETAGHAMKADDAQRRGGAILGKAMTELKEGKGLVLVLVTLQ